MILAAKFLLRRLLPPKSLDVLWGCVLDVEQKERRAALKYRLVRDMLYQTGPKTLSEWRVNLAIELSVFVLKMSK